MVHEQAERTGDIEKISIRDINIGDRARVDMGDIESMAVSLQIEGQLTPIIVDIGEAGKFNLVEGERRIHAARSIGWTTIEAIKLKTLTPARRKELEIIHCVQRKQLDFIEEARAVKQLVELRKQESLAGGLAKFGKSIRNKDVALELNMSEARMSENLKIADNLEKHPELEAKNYSRTEFLRRVRNQDFFVVEDGAIHKMYKENYLVTTPIGCLDTINDRIIDLAILHPDKFSMDLLKATHERLKPTGQIIAFTAHKDIRDWEDGFASVKMNVGYQPYIWHIKKEENYENFIWAGKNLTAPIRPLTNMISAARPVTSFSPKAKPMQLMTTIIRSCTERGAFVVVPQCEDIETVRCCLELGRNVRAATGNKILRDKLILSVSQTNN